jgi:hypothetical protein
MLALHSAIAANVAIAALATADVKRGCVCTQPLEITGSPIQHMENLCYAAMQLGFLRRDAHAVPDLSAAARDEMDRGNAKASFAAA